MKKKQCDICNTEKPIWKNQSENGVRIKYCRQCWSTHKQKAGKPTKQIRPRSKKKEKQDKEYSILRMRYLVEHPICEVNYQGCTTHATDIHHKAYRGVNQNNVETFAAVCRNCHTKIHLFPKESREQNLLE